MSSAERCVPGAGQTAHRIEEPVDRRGAVLPPPPVDVRVHDAAEHDVGIAVIPTICTTSHSDARGIPPTRGGRTLTDGTGVSPATRIRPGRRENRAEVKFIFSSTSSDTMLADEFRHLAQVP